MVLLHVLFHILVLFCDLLIKRLYILVLNKTILLALNPILVNKPYGC